MFSRQNRGKDNASPLGALQRLAGIQSSEEQCDFCSVPLGSAHRHVLEIATRKVLCTCDPCGLRFEGVNGGRYKLIPRRARRLPNVNLTDLQWASLSLPIELAFIFQSTPLQSPVALYPSPSGLIESRVPLTSWKALVAENPRLGQMEPDIEAFLGNRTGNAREYYLVPIDACFELAGVIRVHWRGLTGGTTVWKEVGNFFSRLRSGEPGQGTVARVEVGHA